MDVVSAIPGTNGIIAPITTLSCKTGITPAAAGRLSKEISRLTYTFVKNLETLRFRHTNNASCSISPTKNAYSASDRCPPNMKVNAAQPIPHASNCTAFA